MPPSPKAFSGPLELGALLRQEGLLADAGVGAFVDLAEKGLRDLVDPEAGRLGPVVGGEPYEVLVGLHGQLGPCRQARDHLRC